jgi:hypothetical protein
VELTPEVHVLDDVEVVAESEVLIDDLDPEGGGVLGPVDLDLPTLEQDLPGLDRVDRRT